MNTFYRIIDITRGVLIAAIFGFIMCIGTVQIVLRYSPDLKPLSWVDEIMRYLNIWVVFLAASVGVKESGHLSMDYFLKKYFSANTQKYIRKVSIVINLAALALLIYFGILRVNENWNAQIQSLPISVSWFYLAIPVGSVLIAFDYVLILVFGEHPYSYREQS